MTDLKATLGDPTALGDARSAAHAAVQLLSKAARANLAPVDDGSHSSLQWSHDGGIFVTQPMEEAGHVWQIGLTLADLRLAILRDGDPVDDLDLPGQSLARAEDWLDSRLDEIGLRPASTAAATYSLPGDVAALEIFPFDDASTGSLSAWYAFAATALDGFVAALGTSTARPGAIRCWPHHFDIATYVAVKDGEVATEKGIGVGLSPGDRLYSQPYFYVSPWPHLEPSELPAAIAPGHWHTAGFVGAVATGEEILTLDDVLAGTAAFLHESFAAGHARLAE